MRVLLDTNVLISFLLTPSHRGAVYLVMEAAFSGRFTLLAPDRLLLELVQAANRKSYLADRITAEMADGLVAAILEVAEVLPPLPDNIPSITRDPKDDYLLACALLNQADYLVTGDNDLLSIGDVGDLKIVSPTSFAELLEKTGGDSS